MNTLRRIATLLILGFSFCATHAYADSNSYTDESQYEDPRFNLEAPPAYAMVGDLFIARPAGVVFTAIGTTMFVISLPFTALGGNVGEAADSLVVAPAKMTFYRCLGCTSDRSGNTADKGD